MKNIRLIRRLCLVAALGLAGAALPDQAIAKIINTRHNLSSWSPYAAVRAVSETQVCIFCHTPHNAAQAQASEWAPLWNRADTSSTFKIASTTGGMGTWIGTRPGNTGQGVNMYSQPKGISKKCLSCHDGTISVGSVLSRGGAIPMNTGGGSIYEADGRLKATADGYIGTDLTKGHVISFVYDTNFVSSINSNSGSTRFRNVTAYMSKKMLDREGRMQCHTCHDPHNDWCTDSSSTVGKDPLWRRPCDASGKNITVCNTCHLIYAEYTAPNLNF